VISGRIRLRRKDGNIADMKMREQVFHTEDGEPSFIFCVFESMTIIPTANALSPPSSVSVSSTGIKRKRDPNEESSRFQSISSEPLLPPKQPQQPQQRTPPRQRGYDNSTIEVQQFFMQAEWDTQSTTQSIQSFEVADFQVLDIQPIVPPNPPPDLFPNSDNLWEP